MREREGVSRWSCRQWTCSLFSHSRPLPLPAPSSESAPNQEGHSHTLGVQPPPIHKQISPQNLPSETRPRPAPRPSPGRPPRPQPATCSPAPRTSRPPWPPPAPAPSHPSHARHSAPDARHAVPVAQSAHPALRHTARGTCRRIARPPRQPRTPFSAPGARRPVLLLSYCCCPPSELAFYL